VPLVLPPSFFPKCIKQQQHRNSASLKKSALKKLNCEEIVHAGKTNFKKSTKLAHNQPSLIKVPTLRKQQWNPKKIKETHI